VTAKGGRGGECGKKNQRELQTVCNRRKNNNMYPHGKSSKNTIGKKRKRKGGALSNG